MRGRKGKRRLANGGYGMLVYGALWWSPAFHILMQSSSLLMVGCSCGSECGHVFAECLGRTRWALSYHDTRVHDWASPLQNKEVQKQHHSWQQLRDWQSCPVNVFMLVGLISGNHLYQFLLNLICIYSIVSILPWCLTWIYLLYVGFLMLYI